MERNRVLRRTGEAPALRVYTVCDESRYLIVKNVPSLKCETELLNLFGTCGNIEAYRRLDEECEPFTEVYWIKYSDIANARLAKRRFDDYNFFSNLLNVSYAPKYETVSDTKDKLEERRLAVLDRKSVLQGSKEMVGLEYEPEDPLLSVFAPARPVAAQKAPFFDNDTVKNTFYGPETEPQLPQAQPQAQFLETASTEVYNSRPLHFENASMNETAHRVRETLEKVDKMHMAKRRRI